MTVRLGGLGTNKLHVLASLPLVSALACGGVLAGCSGDDSVGGTSAADSGEAGSEGGIVRDGGPDSGGPGEASTGVDSGGKDSTPVDTGLPDSGVDTGSVDSGTADTGVSDTGRTEGGAADTAAPDTGAPESGGGGTDGAPLDATTDVVTDGSVDAAKDGTAADSGMDATTDTGAPAPVASIPTSLDLVSADCGSTTPTQKPLVITNTGTADLRVTNASFGSNTNFTVSGAPIAAIAPNGTANLTVAVTVPSTATAKSTLTGTLTIQTNDPIHPTTTVDVTVTAHGATLAWAPSTPTSADFGFAPNGVADTPITLTLTNTGNADAKTIAIGTPTDTHFTVDPATTATLAAGSSLTVTAHFTPTTLNPVTATSTISSDTTVASCGTSVSSLGYSGQGAVGVVTGWPSAVVDFLGSPCGATAGPAAQTFTLSNSGNIPVHIASLSWAGYAGYTTDLTTSSVIPAASGTTPGALLVNLYAPPIPLPSPVPGTGIYDGALAIATDAAGDTAPHTVSVTNHAVGAVLSFDTTPTPNFGGFGPVATFTTANQSFNVVNTGNAASNVTLATAAPFSVSLPTFLLQPGVGQAQSEAATFGPTSFGGFSGQVSLAGDHLCNDLPNPLSLSGTGESGGLAFYNQTTLAQAFAFQTNCGTTAAPQTLTIKNVGNQPASVTAISLKTGTWYGLTSAALPISLNAGDTTNVTITPVAIPFPQNPDPSLFVDEIDVTTSGIANDPVHKIGLSETALGDVIVLGPIPPAVFDLGATPVSTSSAAQTFSITNNGNGATPQANLTIASGNADFAVQGTAIVTPGGPSLLVPVTFNAPVAPGAVTSNLTIHTTDALCQPLPGSAMGTPGTTLLPIQALATQAGPNVQPGNLNFGLTNCNDVAAPQDITVTNTGTQDFDVTGATVDNTTYFSLSPTTGHVTANGGNAVVIHVTPSKIPATVASVPALPTYSGTVTIHTNANTTVHDFTVTLTMGAQGVIVTNDLLAAGRIWAFGTVPSGGTSNVTVDIQNAGNWPLQASLNVQGTPPGLFGLTNDPTVETGMQTPGSTAIVGAFHPNVPHNSWPNVQGTLTIAPTLGGVFCAPLPAGWSQPIALTGSSQ